MQPFYHLNCPRVAELIDRQSLKRYWVAEAAGIHKTTLRRWLSGRIDKVRERNVQRLASVLSTTQWEIAEPAVRSAPSRGGTARFLD